MAPLEEEEKRKRKKEQQKSLFKIAKNYRYRETTRTERKEECQMGMTFGVS